MKIRVLLTSVAVAALVACGGGGSSEVAPPLTFNMDAALATALTNGLLISGLRASDSAGNAYSLSFSYAPVADGPFLGQTYKRVTQTVSMTRNGTNAPSTSATIFYTLNPARLVGIVNSQGNATVITPKTSLPTAATVGAQGTYSTANVFASTALGPLLGTSTVLWSLEPDAGPTALACLTTTSSLSSGTVSEKDCFRINPAGAVSGGKVTVTIGNQALTFQ